MSFANAQYDEYGNVESNSIADFDGIIPHGGNPTVDLTDKRLARVTRLRMVSDPGFPLFDISYCYGVLTDGTPCRVDLPFYQLPKRQTKAAIVEECSKIKVYAKGLGLLDDNVISILT